MRNPNPPSRPRGPGKVAWRRGLLALVLAALPHAASAQVLVSMLSSQQAGDAARASLDCPRRTDLLGRMICADPALAAASLEMSRAYAALAQQVGREGARGLSDEATLAQSVLLRQCRVDVHARAPAANGPDWAERIGCLLDGFRAQHGVWLSRLEGPAREEATRPPAEIERAQQDLRALGHLPSHIPADGVLRPSSRAAIIAWQRDARRPVTGLLSAADDAALRQQAAGLAPAPVLSPVLSPVQPVAAAIPAPRPAAAETGGEATGEMPMRFTAREQEIKPAGNGPRQVIFAEGAITPETPAQLAAVLGGRSWPKGSVLAVSSPGGDSVAGMELGRMIRAKGLETIVARLGGGGVEFRGARCHAACAEMFLGGTRRHAGPGSAFGLRRFRPDTALSAARAAAGGGVTYAALLDYVREMGADPAYLTEAARLDGRDMILLEQPRMLALGILTANTARQWDIAVLNGRRLLRSQISGPAGMQGAAFTCAERAGEAPLMQVHLRPPNPAVLPAATHWTTRLFDGVIPIPVEAEDIAHAGRVEEGALVFALRLSPALREALSGADDLRVVREPEDGESAMTLTLDLAAARAQLPAFLGACR